MTISDVRRIWPDIVEEAKKRRRVAWIHLTQNAQVVGFEGSVLTLGFTNAGTREAFHNGGHGDVVRDAANAVVGVTWTIEAIVAPGGQFGRESSVPSGPGPSSPPAAAPPSSVPTPDRPAATEAPPRGDGGPFGAVPADSGGSGADGRGDAAPGEDKDRADATPSTGNGSTAAPPPTDPDDDVDPDDQAIDELSGTELLAKELGASLIEEIPNS